MTLVLAIDLGGSALKASLFDAEGRTVAAARGGVAFGEPREGWSEADPEGWWRALGDALDAISGAAGIGPGDVSIVAICGFTRTQVLLDRDDRPVRSAICFRDRRAAAQAALMRAHAETAADARQLNEFHPLARLMWLRDNEPEIWQRVARVIEPKDYLNLRLTGAARSDAVSLHTLTAAFAGGAASLAARCGIDRMPLPPLGQPLDIVGTVRPGLAGAFGHLAGAKVMLGSNDTWMAVAGMDALAPGRAYCVSGSSEVFGVLAQDEAHAPGLVTVRWGERLWHLGGPGQNGANTIDWAASAIGGGAAETADMPPALVFLPFLLGERTPFWDGDLRGAVLGIDAATTAADIRHALMAGVAFVNRTVLERAEAATGVVAGEIRIGGGGSRNTAWNRIRADVLGRTVLASPAVETGLAGCMAAARVALGLDESLSGAARAALAPFERYEPDPRRKPFYDALFGIFAQAHEAVAPLSHRLAALRAETAT